MHFSKVEFFGILVCNFQTRYVKKILILCLPMGTKIYCDTYCNFRYLRGVFPLPHPQIPLSCQKRQIASTVKAHFQFTKRYKECWIILKSVRFMKQWKKSEYINICFPRSFVCKWKRHSRSICSREIELFSMVFRQENYDKKLCVLYFYHFLIYESNSFLRGWSGLTATLIHLRLIPLSWVKVAN